MLHENTVKVMIMSRYRDSTVDRMLNFTHRYTPDIFRDLLP